MAAPSSWVEGSLRSLRAARRRRATTQNDAKFTTPTAIAIALDPRRARSRSAHPRDLGEGSEIATIVRSWDAVSGDGMPTIEPGTKLLGKYVVERTLGQGGMGAVVAARHTELDVEHLSGHDLDQEVRKHGPLRVDRAITYILHALEALREVGGYGGTGGVGGSALGATAVVVIGVLVATRSPSTNASASAAPSASARAAESSSSATTGSAQSAAPAGTPTGRPVVPVARPKPKNDLLDGY
jgi:hypothetical protein